MVRSLFRIVAIVTLLHYIPVVALKDNKSTNISKNARAFEEEFRGVPQELYDHVVDFDWWRNVATEFGLHAYDSEYFQKQFIFQWEGGNEDTDLHRVKNLTAAELHEFILRYGYHQLSHENLPNWQLDYTKMRALMDFLYENSIPTVYVFMFDEFWYIYMRIHHIIEGVLGRDFWRLTDMWSWRVDANTKDQGWKVHRDSVGHSHDEFGSVMAITVWIPLSVVTTHHSCMHVVPISSDPGYADPSLQTKTNADIARDAVRELVALPTQPGGVLIWDQKLLHFGSAASPRAEHPRYSLSMEFERAGQYRDHRGSYNLQLPTMYQRLMRITALLDRYQHMYIDPADPSQVDEAIEWQSFIAAVKEFHQNKVAAVLQVSGEALPAEYEEQYFVLFPGA